MRIQPRTLGLADAYEALERGAEGSAAYPLSWEADSAEFGVSLHRPVVAGEMVYQVASGKIQALDARTGEEKFSIPAQDPTGPVKLGDRLVCGSRDELFLYDPVRRERVWSLPLESGWGKRPHVTSEGDILAADGNQIRALDGETGKELWQATTPRSAGILGYSSAQRVAVAYNGIFAGEDEKLFAFDAGGRQLWSMAYSGAAALAPEGPLFVVKERWFKMLGSSHSLRAVDPRTGLKLWSEEATEATQLWATPEGDVAVRDGATLRLREGRTGRPLWTYQLHSEPGWKGPGVSLTFTDDELIVTHPDGRMTGLEPRSGRVRWEETSRGSSYAGPERGPEGILVLKTEGKVKALLPASFVKNGLRESRAIEETDRTVQVGGVQLRKRPPARES